MNLGKIIAERPEKIIYLKEDKVIKLFASAVPKSAVLNEALNHARVEEAGVPVPQILQVTKIEGQWALEMEYINGQTLAQLWQENPAKSDFYLQKFVQLQSQIHKFEVSKLNRLKSKLETQIKNSQLDASIRYELQNRLKGMPKHGKLCHGDFMPENIMVTADQQFFVLDWSHATRGNGSADVARTYLLFKLKGEDDLAEKYLKLFCQENDLARQYVNAWLPIVAAAQFSKGDQQEKDFLFSWLDVVDFE